MSAASVVASITYTPPLGSGTCTAQLNVNETYAPQSVGTLDIPVGTAANAIFSIPFGTIAVADILIIKNKNNQDMGLRINGIPTAPAVLYQIPPNGQIMISNPVPACGLPITSAQVDTTAVQTTPVGFIDYYVFGAT